MHVTSQQYALALRRKEFSGRTNKYSPRRRAAYTALAETLHDHGFIDVVDVSYYDNLWRENARERLNRYRRNIKFYQGEHWMQPWENNEPKPVFNFCRVIVDRSVDFFIGKAPFSFSGPSTSTDLVHELDLIWAANNKYSISSQIAKSGAICGDAYIYVTATTKDAEGKVLPAAKRQIKLYVIEPQYCFPKWADKDQGILESVLIQLPLRETAEGEKEMYSIFITADKVRTFANNQKLTEEVNPFGRVNMVHIPNELQLDTPFGAADLDHITVLNEEYNAVANSMRRIIRYHAEPTTLIFGARASDLEKGANKVWSGFPVDGRVENLQLQGDLSSIQAYLSKIEDNIYRLSSMPKQVFSMDQGISNTSGIALQTLYQPVLDKTRRKRQIFAERAMRVNQLIAEGMKRIAGIDIRKLADSPDALENIEVVFNSLLPEDTAAALDVASKKLSLGLSSKLREIKKLENTGDLRTLVMEILSDRMGELAFIKEKTIALEGMTPRLAAVFIDSLASSADFSEFQEKIHLATSSKLQEEAEDSEAEKARQNRVPPQFQKKQDKDKEDKEDEEDEEDDGDES